MMRKFNAPIRTGVEVKLVTLNEGRSGFTIETSAGTIEAIAPTDSDIQQIHSTQYFNPEQLPEGAVLVVGAGSSGTQIADELQRAGKTVYLSVGAHDRPPRSYRNRDFCWWLGVLGLWDLETMQPGKEHVTIAVSGAYGGKTINFRELAHQGVTLVGMTKSFDDGVVSFQPDLTQNINNGDQSYLDLLDAADAYVERNGLDLPEEPQARVVLEEPDCVANPLMKLDLAEAGVTSIIWATGFALDYSWLNVDAFDETGKPKPQRGVSSEPGVILWGCLGYRVVARRLSGACGTMLNTWLGILKRSASMRVTKKPSLVRQTPDVY